jgi:hypothetical protein
VSFPGGTHWFAPELGLIRTELTGTGVVLDLAAPPCLASSFDGTCTVQ